MKRTAVVWTASIVVVALGLGGRAGAQNIEILPPDGSPPAAEPPAGPAETPAAAAAPPAAAVFGQAWHFAVSLERAVGYDHVSWTQGSYGQDSGTVNGNSTTASNFSLFGVPNIGALVAFSFPRVAFDLFVPPHFSVGIGLGALYGSSSVVEGGDTRTTHSFTGLLAAPRVGYALNLATDITLWARGGISVLDSNVETGGRYAAQPMSSRLVAATFELPIVFTVLPRLALTAGPTLDITFSGRGGSPDLPYDEHVTELGIQGGMLIHL